MKCENCGASLLDTDKFCDQCGWKVVRKRRCPECGASLREGTKFCPKCGRLIGSGSSSNGEKVFVRDAETSDIPIADIEQNILFETERELHTAKKPRPASKPKKSVPAPEPKKKERPAPVKKRVYEDWDDEEDEDDEDDDYTGPNVMVIATVVMALLIVLVAAVLFVKIKQPVKDYGENAEEQVQDEEENEDGGDNGETEPEEGSGTDNEEPDTVQPVGTLSIVSDVNVRDNPSTEGTNIIKVAKEGETYEYTGTAEDGNWYVILLEDGSTGYVFEKYVSVE